METIPKVTYRSKSIEIIHIHSNIFQSKVKSNPYLNACWKSYHAFKCSFFLKIIVLKSLRSFSRFAPKILEAKLKKKKIYVKGWRPNPATDLEEVKATFGLQPLNVWQVLWFSSFSFWLLCLAKHALDPFTYAPLPIHSPPFTVRQVTST